jgi:hypothetical protein
VAGNENTCNNVVVGNENTWNNVVKEGKEYLEQCCEGGKREYLEQCCEGGK